MTFKKLTLGKIYYKIYLKKKKTSTNTKGIQHTFCYPSPRKCLGCIYVAAV